MYVLLFPTEHPMSYWVPQTRPASRCPESLRINVHFSFGQFRRGHGPQRLLLAPSVSYSSPTLQTLSCCFHPAAHPWHHASSDWVILYLFLFRGRPLKRSVTVHMHQAYSEWPPKFRARSWNHLQWINTSCLYVLQYYCLVSDFSVFYINFVSLYFCQWY